MAYLKEQAKWEEGIYQYELDDLLQGGEDGIDNVQGKQLANRTLYLKQELEQHQAAANPHKVTASQTGAYTKQETDAKIIEDSYNWALVDESKARNLLDVLGVRAVHSDEPATLEEIKKVMEILHKKINPDGIPDFSGLRLCDYLDLPEINDGTTTYKWNGKYKNLRIMISAFNLYQKKKQKNHIVFTFRNCVLVRNVGIDGSYKCYGDSSLATYLDGAFKSGIEAVIGNYLYNVDRLDLVSLSLEWHGYTIFLPTELEVWGSHLFCSTYIDNECQAQYPIYRDSCLYKVKQYNGLISSWWQGSMCTLQGVKNSFCMCDRFHEYYCQGYTGLGVAPAFCIS